MGENTDNASSLRQGATKVESGYPPPAQALEDFVADLNATLFERFAEVAELIVVRL